ncbi:MAG: PAS domain S-box protein [Pseudomonadota bacterium]
MAIFTAIGVALLLNAMLFYYRRVPYAFASSLTIMLTAFLLLSRLVTSFTSGAFDDSSRSMFMPVHAHYATLYLLFLLLLPYPQSARFSVVAWLVMASITTLGAAPYWNANPPRQLLAALLIYVWLGHGLFVALLFSWAKQQKGLMEAKSSLATAESEARRSLETSEARFRGVFDQLAAGIGLFGMDGRWQEVNLKLCEMLGRSADELIGMPMTDVTPVEDHESFLLRVQTLMSGPAPQYSVERRAIRKDGSTIWLLAQMRRLDPAPGQLAQGVLFAVDITEKKLAEESAQAQQRLREFHLAHIPLALIEWTPDLRVQRWSKKAEEMFGWTEAELLGKTPFEWGFMHEEDRKVTEDVAETLTDKKPDSVRQLLRNYRKDGSYGWYHWHNVNLYREDGTLDSIHSMGSDVSQLQFTLEALSDSEGRLNAVFEQAAVGVSLLNADGSWNKVNQRLCEITGYSESELLATDYQTITLSEDLAVDLERARQLIEGEIDRYDIEKRYVRKDGAIIWVKVFASRIDVTGSQPALYVAVIEDISQRKAAEAHVQRLNSNLEQQVVERTEQLRETLGNWQQRSTELALLNEMMSNLPASQDLPEASAIIRRYLPRLFNQYAGVIWLEDEVPDQFHLLVQWGARSEQASTIVTEDCWALRRGRPLRVEDPLDPLACPHAHRHEQVPHACTPIVALGEIVGMIYLEWSEDLQSAVNPPEQAFVESAAEQIGLAIGNVRLREKLRQQAMHDALTGLYNRRYFDEYLASRIAEATRADRAFSLLMIDLDHFKSINDTFGHDAGDEVLRATGRLLQKAARADEAVFRLGGEEFVMILNEGLGSDSEGCAERLRKEIEANPLTWNGIPMPSITASMGIARFPADGREKLSIMQRADAALYSAKRTGRNRVCKAAAIPGNQGVAMAVVQPNSLARMISRDQQ